MRPVRSASAAAAAIAGLSFSVPTEGGLAAMTSALALSTIKLAPSAA
jgi:hypothetical protein